MNQKEFVNWFSLVTSVNSLLSFFRKTKIDISTLYIMGKQDYMFLPSVKKMVKHHSNAVLETIDNCGHVVNIDASSAFNSIVISYCKKEI